MVSRSVSTLAGISISCGSLLLTAGETSASQIISMSGPTSSFANSYDLSQLGTVDYIDYITGTTGTGITSVTGDEKAGNSSFGPLILVNGSGGTSEYLNKGGFSAAQGATITNDGNGTSPASIPASADDVYARNAAVKDGESFTYSLPANSTQTLSIFVESFDTTPQLTLSSAASGNLYAQPSTGVALPSTGDGTSGASGHSAGIYSFVVSNPSGTPDTLTVNYIEASSNGGSSSVGVQGAAVATPEPSSALTLAAAAVGLLWRRRRSGRRA